MIVRILLRAKVQAGGAESFPIIGQGFLIMLHGAFFLGAYYWTFLRKETFQVLKTWKVWSSE